MNHLQERLPARIPDLRLVIVAVLLAGTILAGALHGITQARQMIDLSFTAFGAMWVIDNIDLALDWVEEKASA